MAPYVKKKNFIHFVVKRFALRHHLWTLPYHLGASNIDKNTENDLLNLCLKFHQIRLGRFGGVREPNRDTNFLYI
jgi:hypothetical protein